MPRAFISAVMLSGNLDRPVHVGGHFTGINEALGRIEFDGGEILDFSASFPAHNELSRETAWAKAMPLNPAIAQRG